jgi:phage repressor protein C with HTH and peptisase S24 domain
MSHSDIWLGLERLAAQHNLSTSGLAKKAGLDATSFNKSKRVMGDGRLRWPSTESIVRVLEATNSDWGNFVALMQNEAGQDKREMKHLLPLISLNKAQANTLFDDKGQPKGTKWDELAFPDFDTTQVFTLEIMGDAYLPIYRDGDRLIISTQDQARRGDRVFIKLMNGQVHLASFFRLTAKGLDVRDLVTLNEAFYTTQEIAVSGRVLWASQ